MMNLSDLGSTASIISFLMTLFVMWQISSLRSFYTLHIMVPKLIKDLKIHKKNVKVAIENKRVEDAKREFGKCDAVIERILTHADNKLKTRGEEIRSLIAIMQSDRENNVLSSGNNAISQIEALIESASAFTSESLWSSRT